MPFTYKLNFDNVYDYIFWLKNGPIYSQKCIFLQSNSNGKGIKRSCAL